MGIALLSLRQAEKVEPQLRAALGTPPAKAGRSTLDSVKAGAAMGLTARERLALRDGNPVEAEAILNARQFVQTLIAKDRETTQAQMVWALGRIEPAELDNMVKQLARMRSRYASLVLEYGQSERPIGKPALEELKGLRERIAEFEHGFEMIKTAILDGTAEVAGVKAARM
jgi:hypothetical protein